MEPRCAVELNSDKPKFPRLLICEGIEDQFFFDNIIMIRNLPRFHIHVSRGRSRFAEAIKAYRISRTKIYRSLSDIVIVADNDENPDASFRNVCDQIEKVFGPGTAPERPQQKTMTKPAVTVLMIPWTDKRGHLEKLCVSAAKAADKKIAEHVDYFMALIVSEKWNNESRQGKAWLRTNLAARCAADPFVPLGHIFSKDEYRTLIPLEDNSFKDIHNFLAEFA